MFTHDYSDDDILAEIARLQSPETQADHELWLATRPQVIQDLAKRYPFDRVYVVKPQAPYRGTPPGAVVGVVSYIEHTGAPPTIAVRLLRDAPGEWRSHTMRYEVDPQWLEPYEPKAQAAS
jgi:hypothetical protein